MKIDEVLSLHTEMLTHRAQRTQVLANNIANADTPNFKAKELVFNLKSHSFSSKYDAVQIDSEQLYRMPFQKTINGNTVELPVEQAKFAQNMSDYQTSLAFLKMKISGLKSAIKGQ